MPKYISLIGNNALTLSFFIYLILLIIKYYLPQNPIVKYTVFYFYFEFYHFPILLSPFHSGFKLLTAYVRTQPADAIEYMYLNILLTWFYGYPNVKSPVADLHYARVGNQHTSTHYLN